MGTFKRWFEGTSPWVLFALLGATLFACSSLGLSRVPYFGGDEVWPASTAWTLVTEGRFAREVTHGSLHTEVFDAFPPVWILSLSAVYKVLGVGVWTTRLPALLAVCTAVSLLALVGYRISESRGHALLAGLLWALDPVLLQRARIGRSEPFALLLALLGTTFVLGFRQRRAYWVLGGLCFALAVGSYQFAIVSAVAVMVGLLAARQFDRFIWCGIGGAVGVLLWGAWLWGRFSYFQEQVLVMGQHYNAPPYQAFLDEWQRYANLVSVNAPVSIAVFLLSPVAAVLTWRSALKPEERVMSAASITAFALLALVGQKSFVYFVFLSPFAYFCLATCVVRANARWFWSPLAGFSALGGVIVLAGIWYKSAREWECRDEQKFAAAVGPFLSAHGLVVGPTSLWLPTIEKGGRFRLTTHGFGPETTPYQDAFLADRQALAGAALIALDSSAGADLVARYPVLKEELERREKVYENVASGCGPSMFAMSLYAPRRPTADEGSLSPPDSKTASTEVAR